MDAPRQFERLRQVEYGDLSEVTARLVGVGLGGVLLYGYTGWYSALVWGGVYVVIHLATYAYFQIDRPRIEPRHVTTAGLLFLLVFAAFLWMPLRLATQPDKALVFAGATLIASLLAYVVRRSDTILWLVIGQLAMLKAAFIFILADTLVLLDSWLARVGVSVVAAAVIGYLTLAVLSTRALRKRVEEQSNRSAQEQKMAAIGQLAGGIAHDFNNMLTVILGNLELARSSDDPRQRDALLAQADEAAHRVEAVVQQLLIYTRQSTGLARQQDVNDSVQKMMTLAQRLVPRGTVLHFSPCPRPMVIEVDGAQLLTAVINLVSNAVDATPEGGTICVSTDEVYVTQPLETADGSMLRPGRYAAVVVEDTGCGIPADLMRKVVEPFFSTKPPGAGAGLGLPMVIGFARDAGGGLILQSTRSGATASVLLPLALSDARELVSGTQKTATPDRTPRPPRTLDRAWRLRRPRRARPAATALAADPAVPHLRAAMGDACCAPSAPSRPASGVPKPKAKQPEPIT